jgi:hypothetical protein
MVEVGGRGAWQLWSEASRRRSRPLADHRRLVTFGVLVAVLLFVGYLWAGYGLGWRWTGLSSKVTLWDWLQVLALPAALGVAPLLLQHHQRLRRRYRAILAAVLVGFAILVAAGYLLPLPWTGFTGNTLWDWLELVLLPLVVGSASLWTSARNVRMPHLVAGTALVAGFALLVAGGYLVPWTWTGFAGNTVWDWIKLLLLPVLVPTVLLPAVHALVTERLISPEQGRDAGQR